MSATPSGVDVRRADDRFLTTAAGWQTRHAFSFGQHYDPGNTGFGLLLVHDETTVLAGSGFDLHPHRDVEIVTWVLAGALEHEDSTGHRDLLRPGQVQRMSAGSGVRHAEHHAVRDPDGSEDAEPVRFVQAWVLAAPPGGEPGCAGGDVSDALRGGALVPVVSGRAGHAPVGLRQPGAALHVGRLPDRARLALPDAPYVHVFVARGEVDLEGDGPLRTGDAARLTSGGGRRVSAVGDAEVLVWEMTARL